MNTPKHTSPISTFEKFFPTEAVAYCFQLWQQHNFKFIVSKKRSSKLGDYRYNFIDKTHTITVNSDLNKFSFTVTYIHEVAHLVAGVDFGRKIAPHGTEWKATFKAIMQPLLHNKVFPPDVLVPLQLYLKNAGASSCSDPQLLKALQQYDHWHEGIVYLADILLGETFEFNKRVFKKQELRRTRSLCIDMSTNKRYLIAEVAKVSRKVV
ncbi:MAG: hypothetical protein RL060_610 [Bacteroidota bacterium]|jgi:hypothetical protein